MSLIASALSYHEQSLSVIPVNRGDKRPHCDWQLYQSQLATAGEIRSWWEKWPEANVAVITGSISGLVVLDIDGPEAAQRIRTWLADREADMPVTPTVRTGRGWHYYFAHPGVPTPNASRWQGLDGIDIRGDGGYVVAPPSIHANGKTYQWVRSLEWHDLAPCPDWLLTTAPHDEPGARNRNYWSQLMTMQCFEGSRNSTLTRLVGHWLGNPQLDPHMVELAALGWGLTRCDPPLSVGEIHTTVDSIAKRELTKRRGIRV